MAAGDFVKVAAAQLRRASMMLKQEAQSMLNERERTARQVSSQITTHQVQLRARQVTLNDPRRNSQERQRAAADVRSLQQMINAQQREMNRVVQQLAMAAKAKQLKAINLDSQAGGLESQVSRL